LFTLIWGGAVDLKDYCPTQNVTGPNIVNKLRCYWSPCYFTRPRFDRSLVMQTFPKLLCYLCI